VRTWLRLAGHRLYWRVLTPLVLLWGFIFQRLHADHTCDAALTYLKSGAADSLACAGGSPLPLCRRLASENTSAYVQGRNRLPLALIEQALRWVQQQVLTWVSQRPAAQAQLTYHGRAVRVLDGTTFRLRPYGDLASTYGQTKNQRGLSYWVVPKSVASFCLLSRLCIGYTVAGQQASEPALVRTVISQDPQAHCLYLGDQGLGVYRVAQVARHLGHDVLLRLEPRTAKRLLRSAGITDPPGRATNTPSPGSPPAPRCANPICPASRSPAGSSTCMCSRTAFARSMSTCSRRCSRPAATR
jgi:hypothetical protein